MKQNTHLLAQVAISAGRGASSSSPSSAPAAPSTRASARRPRARRRRRSRVLAARGTGSRSRRAAAAPLMATMRSPGRRPARRRRRPRAHRGHDDARRRQRSGRAGSCVGRAPLAAAAGGLSCLQALDDVLQPGDDREGRGQPGEDRRACRAGSLEVERDHGRRARSAIWKNGRQLADPGRRRMHACRPPRG